MTGAEAKNEILLLIWNRRKDSEPKNSRNHSTLERESNPTYL
jgi:hypothetical protein